MANNRTNFETIDPNDDSLWANAPRYKLAPEESCSTDTPEFVKAITFDKNVQFHVGDILVQVFAGDYLVLDDEGSVTVQAEADFELFYKLEEDDALDAQIEEALEGVDPELERELEYLFGGDVEEPLDDLEI